MSSLHANILSYVAVHEHKYGLAVWLQALAAAEQARVEAEQAEAEEAAQRIRIRSEKEAGLPDEVPVGSTEPHVTCMFRLPDGSRVARRFRMTDPVQLLFDVVDSKVRVFMCCTTCYDNASAPHLLLHVVVCSGLQCWFRRSCVAHEVSNTSGCC